MIYVVAFFAVFVVAIAFFIFFTSGKKKNILITGICESGKTALFTMLAHKHHANTFTSLAVNTELYEIKTKTFSNFMLFDVPGHEKLRFEFVNKNKSLAAGVIYVIDSTTIRASVKDVAEYLYNLLTDAVLAKKRTPFLIVCNKQDLPNAKNAIAVEKLLEIELNTLCRTKADALAVLDNSSGRDSVPLIQSEGQFSFSDSRLHTVTFAECNATNTNISQVRMWLERL